MHGNCESYGGKWGAGRHRRGRFGGFGFGGRHGMGGFGSGRDAEDWMRARRMLPRATCGSWLWR